MDDSSNRSPIDAAIEVYLANEIINNYMQHILDNEEEGYSSNGVGFGAETKERREQ